MARDAATQAQVDSADPRASTWLSANAGSGKTRVLTDRVARLLLVGTNPQNILCLTYTKAAASEMQNRLFRRLGEWAMMPEGNLRDQLLGLGIEEAIDSPYLAKARKLFAAAIETPGGLKIQTIHSFCAGILRRFPLEAGISPQFREMEDHESRLLRMEVLDDLAGGGDSDLVDGLAQHYTGAEIGDLLAEIVSESEYFEAPDVLERIADITGIPDEYDETTLCREVFAPGDGDLIAQTIKMVSGGSANDQKAASKLTAIDTGKPLGLPDLVTLESVLLFGAKTKSPFGAKIGSFPVKATREAHPDIVEKLDQLMRRVETGREQRTRLLTKSKSVALARFAAAFFLNFNARKQAKAVLDFDDLIRKTRQLLSDPFVAQWVLFRLDGGVDHILVDEAQDTSPEQWKVIELLTQEFTSGQGAGEDRQRSIFVVGDRKQSIYSFQGADPEGFNRMRSHFGRALRQSDSDLKERELLYSFRSSPAILRLVDQVFTGDNAAGVDTELQHLSFHADMPGRVDLWPALEPSKTEEPPWDDPVDHKSETHHTVQLATQISAQIAEMIAKDTIPEHIDGIWKRRPVRAGDILILVRRRGSLFSEIISACKRAGLDIAGADRMLLGNELAVKDIVALLRFLALPEDDLSLAETLKSPLFGWSERALFDLAHPRPKGQTLWEALRKTGKTNDPTLEILNDLRSRTDFQRPYDLINRILIHHDGRRRLIARLGDECEDGIDGLLSQALAYEQGAVPSLTGFLAWFEAEEIEIKRQMDNAGNRIRVMTVHGAKGLEAPIVILPDTTKRRRALRGEIAIGDGTPFWRPKSEDLPTDMTALRDAAQAREDEEFRRLLYVALTRAESWLIVAAAGDVGKPGESWYQMVSQALSHLDNQDIDTPFGPIARLSQGEWGELPLEASTDRPEPPSATYSFAPDLPDPPAKPQTRAPSDLGGAKALPTETNPLQEDTALARGRLLHLLLEHLPTPDEARALIDNHPDSLLIDDPEQIIHEALSLLSTPALTEIFQTGLAEVEISANLPALSGDRIHGAIDRLLVSDTEILAVDFKSNRAVPTTAQDVPLGLLRQMAAYRDALSQIYPDRQIKTALLWTKTADLMPLPDDLLTEALTDISSP